MLKTVFFYVWFLCKSDIWDILKKWYTYFLLQKQYGENYQNLKRFQPARNDITIHIVDKIKGLRLWFWLFKWRFTLNYVYNSFRRKYIGKEELSAKSTSADITLGLNKIGHCHLCMVAHLKLRFSPFKLGSTRELIRYSGPPQFLIFGKIKIWEIWQAQF